MKRRLRKEGEKAMVSERKIEARLHGAEDPDALLSLFVVVRIVGIGSPLKT